MKNRLVHVGVRTTDLKSSIRFWRDGLGLEVVESAKNRYDLTDGYHNFRVFQHNGPERPPHVGGMLDYLHIGIHVDDLAATAERLETAGFRIIWEDLGGRNRHVLGDTLSSAFKVEDPDGIVVDVTSDNEQWPGVTTG